MTKYPAWDDRQLLAEVTAISREGIGFLGADLLKVLFSRILDRLAALEREVAGLKDCHPSIFPPKAFNHSRPLQSGDVPEGCKE